MTSQRNEENEIEPANSLLVSELVEALLFHSISKLKLTPSFEEQRLESA